MDNAVSSDDAGDYSHYLNSFFSRFPGSRTPAEPAGTRQIRAFDMQSQDPGTLSRDPIPMDWHVLACMGEVG